VDRLADSVQRRSGAPPQAPARWSPPDDGAAEVDGGAHAYTAHCHCSQSVQVAKQ
jgi:hypothetical protein